MPAQVVLVTGASGFLGSHVARRWLTAGAEVHVLQRPSASLRRLQDVRSQLTIHSGDVTDYPSILACYTAAAPTRVLHFAADTTVRHFSGEWSVVERSLRANLEGTLNMIRGALESGAPVSMFLRVGGLEEYGTGQVPFDESQREAPISPYSASQVATTHYAQMLQHYVRLPIVTLRPALVYGPGQSFDFFIPSLIRSCLRGVDFEMTAGTQQRDLLFVDDVVDAVMCAARRPELAGQVINVGSGQEYSLRFVAEEILRLAGANIRLRFGAGRGRARDLEHLVACTRRSENSLGWQPTITLQEGLSRTIAWYRGYPKSLPQQPASTRPEPQPRGQSQ